MAKNSLSARGGGQHLTCERKISDGDDVRLGVKDRSWRRSGKVSVLHPVSGLPLVLVLDAHLFFLIISAPERRKNPMNSSPPHRVRKNPRHISASLRSNASTFPNVEGFLRKCNCPRPYGLRHLVERNL